MDQVVDSGMVVVNVTVWAGHTECYRGTCVRGDTKITFWHVFCQGLYSF